MHHIVSRGHTRYLSNSLLQSLAYYIFRPLTEINFVQDGPRRTLLISSAHGKLNRFPILLLELMSLLGIR